MRNHVDATREDMTPRFEAGATPGYFCTAGVTQILDVFVGEDGRSECGGDISLRSKPILEIVRYGGVCADAGKVVNGRTESNDGDTEGDLEAIVAFVVAVALRRCGRWIGWRRSWRGQRCSGWRSCEGESGEAAARSGEREQGRLGGCCVVDYRSLARPMVNRAALERARQ